MKELPHSLKVSRRGFSLVEVMVAMTILAILVIVMTQLLATSSSAINASTKYMSADGEARQIFNRMEVDFSGLLKRTDVDVVFYKPELAGTSSTVGPNDSLFFYSQAPGYFSTSDSANASPIALLGYRIDSNSSDKDYQQLERLGQGLTWNNSTSGGSNTGGLVYLTWNPSSGFSPSSSISSWSAVGPPPYNTVSSTLGGSAPSFAASYEVLGAEVFRFEVCFVLKDGSYSDYPVTSLPPSGWNSSYTYFTSSSSSPTPTSGQSASGTSGFTAGSRWYNSSTGEAFRCTSAAPNHAVWTGAGIEDISTVIVTLAILDNSSRQMILTNNLATDLNAITSEFSDSGLGCTNTVQNPAPTLPEKAWNTYIVNHISAMGVPQQVAGKIRVYQRAFNLNTQAIGQ